MTTHLGLPPLPPHASRLSHLRGDTSFTTASVTGLANATQRANLHNATTTIRGKRQQVITEIDDWEGLRDAGSAIKRDVLARLPELLEQFEASVTARGGNVHWARDAEEAGEIVAKLVKDTGETNVVKIKSMATQEIALNEQLETHGIHARETDLAELIVQLGHDKPSHILVPAIHRNREEIRDIFLREMPNVSPDITSDPAELAEASRVFLREQFMAAKVAICGANFGIAETGHITIVESEGNGRMCLTLPDTLISVMGIEKILPTFQDYEVFLQLLPRSSTGERMNPYTSLWTGVTEGDGPQSFHIVLLDNGRTAALANDIGREALKCIRCSACLNVCPVYERAGGHAYGSTYPGPIGAILSPQLTGIDGSDDSTSDSDRRSNNRSENNDVNASLPFASSLCGRCNEVCPVKIPITDALLELRHQKATTHPAAGEKAAMKALSMVWGNPALWNAGARLAALGRILGGRDKKISHLPGFLSGWTDTRDIDVPPKQSFRAWFASDEAQQQLKEARNERQG